MTEHELKTVPTAFQAVWDGIKTFEFRKNDRDFQVGDTLDLREFNPTTNRGEESGYTGRRVRVRVTYILEGRFAVPMGYCVMSIAPMQGKHPYALEKERQ